MAEPDGPGPALPRRADDTGRIVRFMLAKAALFIGVPLAASALAVWLTLR